jgi:RNA polymerase sigma-70 factor (ECF subfamily)
MVRALTSEESRREDAELIAHILTRISEGEAQRRLVEKYWQLLVAWVRPRVADPSQAEDVAQETFLRAFKALDRLEDPRRFVPWLLKISTNRAADLRRRRRDQSLERYLEDRGGLGGIPAPGVDLGEELDRQEDYRSVLAAVDHLPEKYRLVIMLRYFEGLTGNQIASALGEPEGTVRNRLFRAHARIRRILRDFCEKGRGRAKPAGKG